MSKIRLHSTKSPQKVFEALVKGNVQRPTPNVQRRIKQTVRRRTALAGAKVVVCKYAPRNAPSFHGR